MSRRHNQTVCTCGATFATCAGFWVNKPVGMGVLPVDTRLKSRSGARIGWPGELGRRRFIKTQKTLVCVGCSLRYRTSVAPREGEFKERARRR